MYNTKQTITAVIIAMAMGVQAQTPAKELVKNNPIVQLERGQAIDIYGDYTVVGSKFGYNGVNGVGTLFYQNTYVRDYRLTSSQSDGLGRPHTLSIDQHALVVSGAEYAEGGNTIGKIAIFKKTWDGTHYSPTASQTFTGSVGTGFGAAVGISDNWIAVGAPTRNSDGGVRLYFRNPSNGNWEDKGWLTTPSFANAPFRFRDGFSLPWQAKFGSSISVYHNNLIVGAPGVGSFYIFEFNGTNWVYSSEYKGTKDVGQTVSISDEYAVAAGNNNVEVVKKAWGASNPWPLWQSIVTPNQVYSVATENSRLIVGEPNGGTDGKGQVTYYEIRSHQIPGTWNWINDFVKIGKLFVNPAASPNGLQEYRLLGYAVAIYQNSVVAGSPNAKYTSVADGAGFKGDFNQYAPAREEGEEEATIIATPYLFPNPTSEAISVSAVSEVLAAFAINAVGVKVNLPVVGNKAIVSGLTAGLYTVTVSTSKGDVTQHVVIK